MSHCYWIPDQLYMYHNFPSMMLTIIPERLYLAAYIHPPTDDTLFPYPEQQAPVRRRGQRTAEPTPQPKRSPPCYFTVDDTLLYNAFHHDFGPLHIGHLYRFAIQFHDILGAKENKDRPVVFWSAADPRSKSLDAEDRMRGHSTNVTILQVVQMPHACLLATWS